MWCALGLTKSSMPRLQCALVPWYAKEEMHVTTFSSCFCALTMAKSCRAAEMSLAIFMVSATYGLSSRRLVVSQLYACVRMVTTCTMASAPAPGSA